MSIFISTTDGDGTGHYFTEDISKEKMGELNFSFFLPHFHIHQLLRCSWEESHLDRTTGHHNGLTQQNPGQILSTELEFALQAGSFVLFQLNVVSA